MTIFLRKDVEFPNFKRVGEDRAKSVVDLLAIHPGRGLAQCLPHGTRGKVGGERISFEIECVKTGVTHMTGHVIDTNRRQFLEKSLEDTNHREENHRVQPM